MGLLWLAIVITALGLGPWFYRRKSYQALAAAEDSASEGFLTGQMSLWDNAHFQAALAKEHSGLEGIRQGTETRLQWFKGPTGSRRVLVYLHGFSASPDEIAPVPERVAQQLGAHFFAPRLSGHGLSGEALADTIAEDWIQDVWDLWEQATLIADRVVLVASSTGATLAASLLRHPRVRSQVDAVVFLSPNFGIKRISSWFLNWRLGIRLMQWLAGKEWSWQPTNDLQRQRWTYRYPVRALHQVQRLVQWTLRRPLTGGDLPLCVVQCRTDKTVSAPAAAAYLANWSGPKQWHYLPPKEGTNNHVLAGDATRPENNSAMEVLLTDFLKSHGCQSEDSNVSI